MTDAASPTITAAAEPSTRVPSRRAGLAEALTLYVLCIGGALVLSAALVASTGGSWVDVFRALLDGSIRKPGRLGLTIGVAAPILLIGLGTAISGKAGLVNIGQEGQMVMGASVTTYVAVRMGGPGPVVLLVALAAGVVGGAIWSGIAGYLRYWHKVPEVLTTLLLGTVAANLMGWGLKNRWLLLAPPEGRANRNQVSKPLDPDTRIPQVRLFGNTFPISVFAAVALAIGVAFVMSRTVAGFRLRMLGRNARTAQRAGVAQKRYGFVAMLLSGAFAGLAGGIMLAGEAQRNYQLVANFGAGIGFAGLLAALVARQRALLLIFVAFVFASLKTGSSFLRATGVSARISDVVQGMLVLAMLLPPAIIYVRARRRALAATSART